MGLISKAKSIFSTAANSIRQGLKSAGSIFKPKSGEQREKAKKQEEKQEGERPVLDKEDLKDSENLDELYERYRESNYEVESISDTYEEAQKDWWKLNNDYKSSSIKVDRLPHDRYKLKLGPQGYFRMDFNVSGISHGQEYFSQMDDEVRQYLIEEIEEISEDAQVYMEDGFDTTVFNNYFEEHENVETLDDRKLLGMTGEVEKPGLINRFLLKYFIGPVVGAAYSMKKRAASEETGKNYVMSSSLKALEDPEEIPRLQHYVKAHTLPRRFRKDKFDRRMNYFLDKEDEMKAEIDRRKNIDSDGFMDSLKNGYRLATLGISLKKLDMEKKYHGFQEVIQWERSKYMAHEAARRGYEDLDNEVWLLVGAVHQADIEQYLEEEGVEELQNSVNLQDFVSQYAVSGD